MSTELVKALSDIVAGPEEDRDCPYSSNRWADGTIGLGRVERFMNGLEKGRLVKKATSRLDQASNLSRRLGRINQVFDRVQADNRIEACVASIRLGTTGMQNIGRSQRRADRGEESLFLGSLLSPVTLVWGLPSGSSTWTTGA
jgi:hypothetical protein